MKITWHFFVLTIFDYFHQTTPIYVKDDTKKPVVVPYGEATVFGEAPYFVSVKERLLIPEKDRDYDNYCSGSIIKPDLVVSVAHCFVDRYTENWNMNDLSNNRITSRSIVRDSYVVAGQIRSSSLHIGDDGIFIPQWRPIKDVIVPKRYHYPLNDLALVKLKKKFTFNSNVQAIPYAQNKQDYNGLMCSITGFGKTNNLYKYFTPILMNSNVEVLNNNECKQLVPYLEETMLCSITRMGSALEDDSGGPLVCKNTKDQTGRISENDVLVGVLSSYITNATIYTRVSAFYKYIDTGGKNKVGELKYNLHLLIAIFTVVCLMIEEDSCSVLFSYL